VDFASPSLLLESTGSLDGAGTGQKKAYSAADRVVGFVAIVWGSAAREGMRGRRLFLSREYRVVGGESHGADPLGPIGLYWVLLRKSR
jgi:hypothetical protein